ncbi:MAG: PDZ domain-containing protein [Tuberibacillus sp.]
MDMLITILQGIATTFYNPFLYMLIAVLFLISLQRVRRERLSFGLKVYGVFNTVLYTIGPSLLLALIGSAVLLGIGVALPAGVVALITCCSILLLLTGQLRYFTATISVGMAIVIAFVLPEIETGMPLVNRWIQEIREASLTDLGILLSVVVLLESLAVFIWGSKQLSPRLLNSKRGKKVGAIEANRLWIVPLFLLLPNNDGAIHAIQWWPFTDGQFFGICALPVGLSLQQLITHSLPVPAIKRSAYWLLGTGLVVAVLTVLAEWLRMDWIVLTAGIAAVMSRLALILKHFYDHAVKPFYFINEGNGLRVVGVIPNTPADRMGVQMGEVVSKVNGMAIRSEEEFYQALQINPTYCKMDVLNYDGEIRFVKGMVHENDLHNIGLLFLEPSRRVKENDEKASS